MRICLDIDDTINFCKSSDEEYGNERPQPGAVETIKRWKAEGHYIILYTARHMKTCDGNQGKVLAKQAKNLFSWLDKFEIPYDEIWWSAPHADIFINDAAINHVPGNWEHTTQLVDSIIQSGGIRSSESRKKLFSMQKDLTHNKSSEDN
jgi:capsule biosynthesis phosphatase